MDQGNIRPDFERIRRARNEKRTPERLSAHYQIEARLARQLSQASRAERSHLYADVYRELFAAVLDHPQHGTSTVLRAGRIQGQAASLLKQLGPDATYVEVGCGDAVLTKVIAAHVRSAVGVDVTPVLVSNTAPPAFRFVQSDGITLDLATGSADLVFSNQLMEHLHVEDAVAQLQDIHRVLKLGGRYVCCTPNRLTGPHDISMYFGHQPTGFHMREYDHRSLGALFRSAGFSNIAATVSSKGYSLALPVAVMGWVEGLLEAMPVRVRTTLALFPIVVNMAGVNLVGTK